MESFALPTVEWVKYGIIFFLAVADVYWFFLSDSKFTWLLGQVVALIAFVFISVLFGSEIAHLANAGWSVAETASCVEVFMGSCP